MASIGAANTAHKGRAILPKTDHSIVMSLAGGLLLLLFLSIGLNLGLQAAFRLSSHETVLGHSRDFLTVNKPDEDSWIPMVAGLRLALYRPDQLLYQEIFFAQGVKFQYPPPSLLFIYPLLPAELLGSPEDGAWLAQPVRPTTNFTALDWTSWLAVVVNILFVPLVLWEGLTRVGGYRFTGLKAYLAFGLIALLSAALACTFYPIVKAYTLGQIQTWLNALFALLFWCWLRGHHRVAGVLCGIMCLVKPQYGLLLVWALLRRRWQFASATVLTGVLGVGLSIAIFGLANNLDYLNVLPYISRHGEAFYPNQSVNGLLNRMLFNGSNLLWDGNSFAPFHPWVYVGTMASSLALIVACLVWNPKNPAGGSVIDLALIALTATIASPVAWEHHYGALLPIYAFLLPCLMRWPILGRATYPLLASSYLLAANFLSVTNLLATTRLNFVQSYLFFAALFVLFCLYRLRSIWAEGRGLPEAQQLGFAGNPAQ